jgi:hypothetical protein
MHNQKHGRVKIFRKDSNSWMQNKNQVPEYNDGERLLLLNSERFILPSRT